MSDAALGQDQFQPVNNRRAGYGDALEMAMSAARKGWTLSAGQGALIVEHYETLTRERDEAVKRRREIDDEAFDYAEQIETLRTQLAAARVVDDAKVGRFLRAYAECEGERPQTFTHRIGVRAALTAALTQEDA
jgi:hypothetical protein